MLISEYGEFCSKFIEAGRMTYASIMVIGSNGCVLYSLPTLVDIAVCYKVDESVNY